jgi:antitoxin ParD1/3/4
MIERRALSVSLTPELHGFVQGLVGAGNYGSASEVVRAGLRPLQEREAKARPAPAAGSAPSTPLERRED